MSFGNSRVVVSNQAGVHPDLGPVLATHLTTHYERPIGSGTEAAFDAVQSYRLKHGGPLILDAGCGMGESTRRLASSFPDHFVVGVDKSRFRLGIDSVAEIRPNCVIARADLVDFWRLARAAGWRLARHYLFYPNPWPKKKHLRRRWHAHPVFPALVSLKGRLELRSNWRVYVEEFSQALAAIGIASPTIETLTPERPYTAFERKYLASNQALYRCVTNID